MNDPIRANRLRELREAQGLLRVDLAAEFRVSEKTVQRWEEGEIPTKVLRAVAKRFSVSVSHLICDDLEVAA